MNIFFKLYLIYFAIIIPIMGYNHQLETIRSINEINMETLKIPMFLKLWLLTDIILN